MGHPYLATDGQANTAGSSEYTTLAEIQAKLDWPTIALRIWMDTEDDRDRMRRKQAEFLVRGHVPFTSFQGFYTFDAPRAAEVSQLLQQRGLSKPVRVDIERRLYY